MATAPDRATRAGRDRKQERLNLRVTAHQRAVIEGAADAANKDLTTFVLDAAMVDAERVMADRRSFSLPKEQWDAFLEALDRPAADNPRLRRLLESPSILDR
jgi:uncharacterized protein (DUF1778 family)